VQSGASPHLRNAVAPVGARHGGPTDETADLVEQRPARADEVKRLGDRPVVRTIKVGGRPSMSPQPERMLI
jgi:hypothetical protein